MASSLQAAQLKHCQALHFTALLLHTQEDLLHLEQILLSRATLHVGLDPKTLPNGSVTFCKIVTTAFAGCEQICSTAQTPRQSFP